MEKKIFSFHTLWRTFMMGAILFATQTVFGQITITSPQATNDATYTYYQFNYSGSNYYQVYIDTDLNTQTGYYTNGIGADFLISSTSSTSADISKYSGTNSAWGWTKIGSIASFSSAGGVAKFKVARSSIGETATSGEKSNLLYNTGTATASAHTAPFTQNYTSSTPVTYNTPKVGGLDYSGPYTTAKLDEFAKFKMILLGFYYGTSSIPSSLSYMRSKNPSLKIIQYVQQLELPTNLTTSDALYPLMVEVNKNNWWLRYANGGLVLSDPAHPEYGSMINITAWAPGNSSGQKWSQVKASFDAKVLNTGAHFDYAFIDNVWWKPRADSDWRRNGTNQSQNDPIIQSEFRKGQSYYASLLRSMYGQAIVVNSDNDLSTAEYKGQFEASFSEGLIGRNYSIETWSTWENMMKMYKANVANTKNHVAIFHVYLSQADTATVRYGLASAMLDDGYFMWSPTDAAPSTHTPRIPEYDAPIGDPAEVPPTAPTTSGIWVRKYSNGLVLVNPKGGPANATYNVGSGYKTISGAPITSVTLQPRQGMLLLKQ